MKQEKSKELFRYWDSLRLGRPAPKQSEIDPASIRSLLGDTFLLHRDEKGDAVFRLAGSRITAIYGQELKGKRFISLWSGGNDQAVRALIKEALEDQCVASLTFEGGTRKGRTAIFEMTFLPLEANTAEWRSIGAITPVERPFWLGVEPLTTTKIVSLHISGSDTPMDVPRTRARIKGPPLSPENFPITEIKSDNQKKARRIRHLVVFEGGRSD